ncbi:VOC family protein [Kribbella qitaiheensis]|uniref:VOC family protein n=1 Tax=Kribbella qitaiheensis TaxID=1544730 RepID=A0A7G6X737_9ACTN|nr:VOC family protein [Kribbella qitaiheensis]QNE22052.1 VOC family protein [Kribbella qitaiheensis]
MSGVTQATLHHLALTVTDLDASVRWYGEVFDVHPIMDVPHQGGVGRILANADYRLMIALHRHETNDGGLCAETTTGLDHAGFTVGSRADLEQWQDHLEAHGVVRADHADKPLTQSPIADEPYASVLVFRDQDNIQLELFSPVQH